MAGASDPILRSIALNAKGSASAEDKVFAVSGPTHMMMKNAAASSTMMVKIDWDNEEHRRCITACLVNATYLLQREQTNSEKFAPAWWESFHFRRDRVLQCVCKCKTDHHKFARTPFIYGAIFEYVPPDGAARLHPSAPSYIVAFRGTMLWDSTTPDDMRLNLGVLLNEQHLCHRFNHARTNVENFLKSNGAGSSRVWLAGHSLGASMALDVGRHIMTKEELNFPTFLFNPPQVSLASLVSLARRLAPAINRLRPIPVPIAEVAQRGVQFVQESRSAVKHALGKTVLSRHKNKMEEKFERLSPWVPNLYVHPRDVICTGFIDYFEERERHPSTAASTATIAYRDVGRKAVGKLNDRPQLLPSAVLWKNNSSECDAHKLWQWWQHQGPKLELTSKLYKWS